MPAPSSPKPARVATSFVFGPLATDRRTGNGPRRAPRVSARAGAVRTRYASPEAALAARVAPRRTPDGDGRAVSVTESVPGDWVASRGQWEKLVSRCDDLPGANRPTRRPELLPTLRDHDGVRDGGASTATAAVLRQHVAGRPIDTGLSLEGQARLDERERARLLAIFKAKRAARMARMAS